MPTTPDLSIVRAGTRPLPSPWVASILDHIDFGLIFIGLDGTCELNHAARTDLAGDGHPLRIVAGRVRTSTAQDDARLLAAVHEAQRRSRRRLLALQGAGPSLAVAVVPLSGEDGGRGEVPALLILGKRHLCSRLTVQWFCLAYGLTPAESVVLADILAGHEPARIAERTGVAMSTVRTHLRRIREKTSTGGIRELMLVAAAMPPMVSPVHAAHA